MIGSETIYKKYIHLNDVCTFYNQYNLNNLLTTVVINKTKYPLLLFY